MSALLPDTGWPSTGWVASVARADAGDDLGAVLVDAGVRTLHVAVVDAGGALRAKRYPAARATELLERWSFIDAVGWWAPDDRTYAERASHHEPVALDRSTIRPWPFEAAAVLVLGDFRGPSSAHSPRALLAHQVARAERAGLRADFGWETETILLTSEGGATGGTTGGATDPVAALPHNRCWSAVTPAAHAELLDELERTLAGGGVALHHLCTELGPGCLELALGPRPGLAAADDALVAKVTTKAVAERRGLTASFMAQLGDDFPGLCGHPILSLVDTATGGNVLADAPGKLSAVGEAAVAGVVRAAPELSALWAPTVNSYRRYAPGNWAARTATWAIGNYTCGLRVVADHPDDTRLELRLPGADASPHLAMAGLLAAALWGIETEQEPPAETTGVAYDVVDPDIGPIARDLTDAADRLAASARARAWFGDAFVDHHAATRRAEADVLRRHVSAAERQRYLHDA